VSENNLNKKYFTEEDSPIPLIPTDMAWENMLEKLNPPEKRKRRMFFWIPPVGCATFVFLLLAGGMIMWWQQAKKPEVLLSQKNTTEANAKKKTTYTHDRSLNAENDTMPPIATQQTVTNKTTRTADYGSGAKQQPEKMHRARVFNQRNRKGIDPVASKNRQSEYSSSFSFSWPHIIDATGDTAISVQIARALPVDLFPKQPSPDTVRTKQYIVSAGLQWQIPVPFTGTDYYFKGPDGGSQPYRLFIPGVWLGIEKGKHQLIAHFIPFASTPLPNRSYERGLVRTTDSLVAYKSMVKTFGLQTGLYYHYQLNKNWWIGAGIDGNWWKKGLVLADDTLGYKPFLYSTTPKKENKLTPFQLSTGIETGVRIHTWEGILQLNRPWNATLKGLQPPVWLRVTVRYQLGQIRVGRLKNAHITSSSPVPR